MAWQEASGRRSGRIGWGVGLGRGLGSRPIGEDEQAPRRHRPLSSCGPAVPFDSVEEAGWTGS